MRSYFFNQFSHHVVKIYCNSWGLYFEVRLIVVWAHLACNLHCLYLALYIPCIMCTMDCLYPRFSLPVCPAYRTVTLVITSRRTL